MWNDIGVLTVCGQCHILSVGVKNNSKLLEGGLTRGLTIKGVNSRGTGWDTGWETLEARREKQKMIIFFKMMHGLCPGYLNQLVPDSVQNRPQYLLRNADTVSTIHTNSVLYYNSFLPSAVRTWINLSSLIRCSTALNDFKRKLSEHMIKPPNYFNYEKKSCPNSSCSLTFRMQCLKATPV